MMFIGRLDGASPGALGVGMELRALTAVLMGGVAFAGGRGKLSGVFFAVLVLGTLENGLVLMNVSAFHQLVAVGGVLVLAAGLDALATRLEARDGRTGPGTWTLAALVRRGVSEVLDRRAGRRPDREGGD